MRKSTYKINARSFRGTISHTIGRLLHRRPLMHNTHLVGLCFIFLVSLLLLEMSKTFYSCHDEHLGTDHLTWRGVMVFLFRSEIFFWTTQVLEYSFFFCRAKREIFSQNLILVYMTKTLNQIILFSSTKIRIFFQQHWESEYLKKNKP